MDIVQNGRPPCHFITSATSNPSEGLLAVRYRRVQPESPVFTTLYDGINQNVDIKVTTEVEGDADTGVSKRGDLDGGDSLCEGSTSTKNRVN